MKKGTAIIWIVSAFMAGIAAAVIGLNSHSYDAYTEDPNITLKEYWKGK